MSDSYSPIPEHLISKAFGKFLVAIRSWLMSELEFVRSEIRRRFRINYSAACSAVPYTMCGLDGQSTVEENVSWRDLESGQDAPRLSVPGFKTYCVCNANLQFSLPQLCWRSFFVNINLKKTKHKRINVYFQQVC